MATIRSRKKADGTVSYTAQIRINRDKVTVYQETQTFARKQAAQAWVRKRESELDEPGAIERARRKGATFKEMADRYLVEVEKARPLGKTKKATLTAIGSSYFGKLNDTDINTQCLVDFALWRMSKEGGGVQPQTAGNDLAHLGAVLAIAKAKEASTGGATNDELIREGARALLARDRALENWLTTQVGPAYDALEADASRALSADQVRARLAAEHRNATERS